jgi:hypothetical protein
VSFDVEVALTFESVAFVIQGGKFMAVESGGVQAKGTLKCEGAVVCRRPLGKLKFPGRISFGDGVPIKPFARGGERASRAAMR